MSARLWRSVAAVLTAALVAVGTTGAPVGATTGPPGATSATGPGVYIVTLAGEPSAVYDGGIDGYAPTLAENGRRFDRSRPAVVAYESRLHGEQDRLLSRIGDPEVLYRMATAVNGFVAELTTEQVKQLRSDRDVALVERSTKQELDTVESPEFLGLDEAWEEGGGPQSAGEGIVIGVVDSGIWPENPSFAGVPRTPSKTAEDLPGFHGGCQRGEQWDAEDCDDKVVSARYYVKGFGAGNLAKSEFLSPRDGIGHGSHAASVAAGNNGVAVDIEGQDFGKAWGMAPAARIATYKPCWAAPNPEDDGCATSDTVAAIDQAVADGVDVLNYSISGPAAAQADSVQRAFLNAAASGVFVAASAGTDAGAHATPWVTTVGASEHFPRLGSVRLSGGGRHVGVMVSDDPVPETRLVLGSEVAAPDTGSRSARICDIGSLDPAAVDGRIVVCDRGDTARVDKSAAVARAGGVGMVLANVERESRDADLHSVPTVHLDAAAAADLKAAVRTLRTRNRPAAASLDPDGSGPARAPQMAEFSTRGTGSARDGEVLKPDLSAPGVGVLAAVAPPSGSGRLWDLRSGTSTSSAHVAGLAAFVKAVRPRWSPARIKSAMMTTAYDAGAGPLTEGAGHVDPRRFLDPGLVYDASADDWHPLLSGRVRGRDVNQPSIAVGALTGRTTVTREVTNASGTPETFRASFAGLDGVSATVQPAVMTLEPDESRSFRVTFEVQPDAPAGSFVPGALTWAGTTSPARTRIPVVVAPQAYSAPREVTASAGSGTVTVTGRSGPGGSIALRSEGVAGATPTPVSLVPGSFDPAGPRQDRDTLLGQVTVPEAASVVRVEMDGHNQADDLDLFAYLDGQLVAASATGSGDETITLLDPVPGTYRVYVSSSRAANESTTTGQLYNWVLTPGDRGKLRLGTDTVQAGVGDRFEYRASWKGLDMTQRWFGAVRYAGSDRRTLISID